MESFKSTNFTCRYFVRLVTHLWQKSALFTRIRNLSNTLNTYNFLTRNLIWVFSSDETAFTTKFWLCHIKIVCCGNRESLIGPPHRSRFPHALVHVFSTHTGRGTVGKIIPVNTSKAVANVARGCVLQVDYPRCYKSRRTMWIQQSFQFLAVFGTEIFFKSTIHTSDYGFFIKFCQMWLNFFSVNKRAFFWCLHSTYFSDFVTGIPVSGLTISRFFFLI